MALTYKKAGVDISKIKQSQKAIGKLISSTHKLQKKAKMTHGFGHYAGIVELDLGVNIPPIPVWLAAHQMMRQTPRIRRVWDLLADGLKRAVGTQDPARGSGPPARGSG